MLIKEIFIHIVLCGFVWSLEVINDVKSLDDSLLFRVNWPGYGESLLDTSLYEKLEMVTSEKEKFHCLVPKDYGIFQDDSTSYIGPNAINLLMPLFKKPICTLRLEVYWTYELCHGQHIKQFHEDREGKKAKMIDYTLGSVSLHDLEKQAIHLDNKLEHDKTEIFHINVEGISMPYFPILYENGTPCDITGTPRSARVLYVCFEEGRHGVYSIKETFSCEYEIIILTSLLCFHPAYRHQEIPQTDLHCIPAEGHGRRPRNLLQVETESLKFRTQGAMLDGDISSGSAHLKVVEDKKGSSHLKNKEWNKSSPLFPSQTFKMMTDFLNGEYCLDGGAGWWQYEFCYGKSVHQYHMNRDGSKVTIHLGSFDKLLHIDWIEKNPHKKFKSGRQQVSYFYSNGDFCVEEHKKRQVEVKLKCIEEKSKSENAVTLYLLEPKVCEYILGVETPLVCHLLKTADEHGLFKEMEANVDGNSLALKKTAESYEGKTVIISSPIVGQENAGHDREFESNIEELKSEEKTEYQQQDEGNAPHLNAEVETQIEGILDENVDTFMEDSDATDATDAQEQREIDYDGDGISDNNNEDPKS